MADGVKWSKFWKILMPVAKRVVEAILSIVTPLVREALEKALLDWYVKAAETESPWDDRAAGLLLTVFGIDEPQDE